MCAWIPSLFIWNYHNIFNWLRPHTESKGFLGKKNLLNFKAEFPIHCTPMTHNAVIWLLEAIAHLHGSYIKYFKITSPIIFDIVPKVFQTKSNLKKKLSANEHFSADSCGWDKNIQMVRVTLKLPSFVSCHCNSKCIIVYIKIPQ